MKHLTMFYPAYVDFRALDGSYGFQFTNVLSIEYDNLNLQLTLKDGTKRNICFLSVSYVGVGNMQDLDLGIHLPETLYL